MIFPQEELHKREVLNELITQFLDLLPQYQFGGRYNEKLGQLLSTIASKTIGCEDRIQLTKGSGYYDSGKVLTRDGIKEIFGYQGKKAREPYNSSWVEDFCKSDEATINLIQLTKSPLIQNVKQLEKVILAMQEIKQLPGNQGVTFIHKLMKNYTIQRDIEKEGGYEVYFNCIEAIVGNNNHYTAIYLTDASLSNTDTGYYRSGSKYLCLYAIQREQTLVEYLRISEPEVYAVIVEKLKETIQLSIEQQSKIEAQYQKVLDNYAEYLVLKAL